MDGTMDIDMDIDIDLNPTLDADPAPMVRETQVKSYLHLSQANGMPSDVQEVFHVTDETSPFDQVQENNSEDITTLESNHTTPNKIHIRGLDDLTTGDVKAFTTTHFSIEEPKIEWINDTSANLVYSSSEIALQALTSLSNMTQDQITSMSNLQLRPAKLFANHPESSFQIRLAVQGDQKKPKAHEASRFYLLHPEHDPRERLKKEFEERRQRGRRSGDSNDGDYQRRRFDDNELRRRKYRNSDGGFDASMYDDEKDNGDDASSSSGRGRSGRRVRFQDRDLFEGRNSSYSGRLRDRSASPGARSGNDYDNNQSRTRKFRNRSPPPRRRNTYTGDDILAGTRELFPDKKRPSVVGKELFPNKTAASNLKKELFPNRMALGIHKRSDAFDAADETTELFRSSMGVPFTDGSSETRPTSSRLADRITRPSSARGSDRGHNHTQRSSSSSGRLANEGFSIKGVAAQKDSGYSIRGAANGLTIKGTASELFPGKSNSNVGKELFSGQLSNGVLGRRAADVRY
ncbi:MAG: hypothetical protein M1834_002724 [Cirrosporium novae-zelandiae]|nr:MAG: hypothetical protein M1834_002724 [Cirrosporium novae-zelandiae]